MSKFFKIFGATVAILITMILFFGVEVNAGELSNKTSQLISLKQTPKHIPQMTIRPSHAANTTSFCGACSNSDHDACGGQSNGWSCCSSGCSDNKMQCWNVVSCDKISGILIQPGGQLASRKKVYWMAGALSGD